jgi:hypothetical protein
MSGENVFDENGADVSVGVFAVAPDLHIAVPLEFQIVPFAVPQAVPVAICMLKLDTSQFPVLTEDPTTFGSTFVPR